MKALYVVIAVLVVTIVRLALHRRSRRWPSPIAALARRAGLLGDTGLVAGREIRQRLRGRLFWVVTLVLFVVVGAAVVVPTVHTSAKRTYRVGVVGASASLDAELQGLGRDVGLTAVIVDEPDLARARAALEAHRLDAVVDGTRAVVVDTPISASDTSAGARFVESVSVAVGAQQAYARAGLTPGQVAALAGSEPLPVESIHPAKKARTTAEVTALLGVILIFMFLTQYLTWTLMGVLEEKASRVVEVLLATVRPIQLLAGKLIGIGSIALAQAMALVAFALLLAGAVGSSLVQGSAPLVVAVTLAWLVLGYAFYSWLYAAAGSLVERQDQVQSLALPLSTPLIFGYIVSLIGVSSGHVSTLVKVLAYLPPTAPFAMPTLVGFGAATWWQFLLSVLSSLTLTVLVALFAARVYSAAALRTGERVHLRELAPALARGATRF